MKIGIFSSLKDKAAHDLVEGILSAIDTGFLSEVELKYVFCDRPEMVDGSLKKRLEKRGITLFTKSSGELRKTISQNAGNEKAIARAREEFDRGTPELIKDYDVDFILLAGYMLIASSFLCGKLKMINLHPDLPGRLTGTWQDIMWQITSRSLRSAGGMIHMVTPELDEGLPLAYFTFSVREPDPEEIRREELRRELPLILLTLKALGKGEIILGGKPRNFSEEVENFAF